MITHAFCVDDNIHMLLSRLNCRRQYTKKTTTKEAKHHNKGGKMMKQSINKAQIEKKERERKDEAPVCIGL